MLTASKVLNAQPVVSRPVRTIVVGAALGGIALDVGVRGGAANALVTLAVFVTLAVLFADRSIRSVSARGWLLLAAIPAAMLTLRASPWLAASNIVLITTLILAGTLYGRSGSIFDTTVGNWWRRAGIAVLDSLEGWSIVRPILIRTADRTRSRTLRIVRAALIAAPFVVVVGMLLASGDVVLATMVTPDIDVGAGVGHVILVGLFTTGIVNLCAAGRASRQDREPGGTFGALESVTILGLTTLVLLLFVVAQLIALTDAGDRLVREAGLTPSEYARRGFFQLCFATLVITVLLATVRRLATPRTMDHRAVRALGTVVPMQTVGLVVVSLRRMALYDQAFGLTMLRLWVVGAAVWMGLVLLMMAARNLGLGRHRSWIGGAAVLAAAVTILGANVANPEAYIVRHNLARARAGASLDIDYLRTLSDDATPAVAAGFPDRSERQYVLDCARRTRGVEALNIAVHTADGLRRELCQR